MDSSCCLGWFTMDHDGTGWCRVRIQLVFQSWMCNKSRWWWWSFHDLNSRFKCIKADPSWCFSWRPLNVVLIQLLLSIGSKGITNDGFSWCFSMMESDHWKLHLLFRFARMRNLIWYSFWCAQKIQLALWSVCRLESGGLCHLKVQEEMSWTGLESGQEWRKRRDDKRIVN